MSTISEDIKAGLISKLQNDPELKKILKRIRENGGDYKDAEKYASRAGQLLTAVLQKSISSANFPVGSVNEIASMIIPAMELNYNAVTQVTGMVQKALNKDGGIGMNSVKPEFDRSNALNLVGRMAKYESFEDAAWMLEEPVQTAALGVTDNTLRKNADFQYKAGMKPKIIRTCESDACEWCQMLAGEYDYEEVKDRSNPVWQRHNNCYCEITYEPGEGRTNDVDSNQRRDKDAVQNRISKHQTMVNDLKNHDSILASKLKYKLNNQLFGGKERADRRSKNWAEGSLKDTVNKFLPNPIVEKLSTGKTRYRRDDSNLQIYYDPDGNYFRIMDTSLKEYEGKRRYVDINGVRLNNLLEEGVITPEEYERRTHIKNTD